MARHKDDAPAAPVGSRRRYEDVQDAIAERTRAELAVAYADAIEIEARQRARSVSVADMHVAMLEGVSRFVADVVLAGRAGGSLAARRYVAEWVMQRVDEQMQAASAANVN